MNVLQLQKVGVDEESLAKSSGEPRHAHSVPGAVEHTNFISRAVEDSTHAQTNAVTNIHTVSSTFPDLKDPR